MNAGPVAEPVAVLAPKRRPRTVLYVAGAIAAVLVVAGGGLAWSASSASAEEDSQWRAADAAHSEEGWQGYVTWADRALAGGGLRAFFLERTSPIREHRRRAENRMLLARAEGAAAREDWAVLCELLLSHQGDDVGHLAQAALSERIDHAVLAYQQLSSQRQTPEHLRASVAAAITLMRGHPCSGGAVIRVETAVDRAAFSQLGPAGSAADIIGAIPTAPLVRPIGEAIAAELTNLTRGALPVAFTEESAPPARTTLDITVRVRLAPRERFVTPDGAEAPGVVLVAEVGAAAIGESAPPPLPSGDAPRRTAEAQARMEATLPPDFAIELLQGGSTPRDQLLQRAYEHALSELFPEVQAHLRRTLGLERFEQRASSLPCYGHPVQPLLLGRTLEGRIESGTDSFAGDCADLPSSGYYDDYGDEPVPERRELLYRLVVPEEGDVAISVPADFQPVLYLRSQCSGSAPDIVCDNENGMLEQHLAAGVYYLFVDSFDADSEGELSVSAARRDPAAIGAACRGATALTPGQAVQGTTARGTSVLWGSWGGVGGNERVHTLELTERSRVRCTASSTDFTPLVYLRSRCEDRDSEALANYRAVTGVIEVGRYAVIVDGDSPRERGNYQLTCEVVPAAGGSGVPGDACAEPASLAVPGGEVVRTPFDTFAAHDDLQVSCIRTSGPDLVYRFEVTEPSAFSASIEAGGGETLWLSSECGGAPIVCGAVNRILVPGTYFLGLDTADPARFAQRTLLTSLAPLAPMCSAAHVLSPGQYSGRIPLRPSRLHGDCGDNALLGAEEVHRLHLDAPTHVRLAWTGTGVSVYMRSGCFGSPGQCVPRDSAQERQRYFEGDLAEGDYFVVVDTTVSSVEIPYQLTLTVTPPGGSAQ